MEQHVIIEQSALVTALGTHQDTSKRLLKGDSAFKTAPCFGIPVAHAPFEDVCFRNLTECFTFLRPQLDLSRVPDDKNLLFIYAAAKGDIRALEPGADKADDQSPLLPVQATQVAEILGIHPACTMIISNACASGAVACATARLFLKAGRFSTAVIAGFDVISHFVTSGFHSLGALSSSGARPFDADRDGLTLGDGAACAVLHCRPAIDGDIIIAGAAQSNDANHRTGPSRTGEGLYRAAAAALENGNIPPKLVSSVKCHGTATVYNDAMEAKAVNRLFAGNPPPCFSVKGSIGHTSGAGSLIEVLLAGEFLRRNTIPPTANFHRPDREAPLPVSDSAQTISTPSILCLSAGFGGLNAAILLREWHA